MALVTIVAPKRKSDSSIGDGPDAHSPLISSAAASSLEDLCHLVRLGLLVTNCAVIVDFGTLLDAAVPDSSTGLSTSTVPQSLSATVKTALELGLETRRFSVGELGGEGGEYWKTNRNTAKRSDLIYWLSRGEVKETSHENNSTDIEGTEGRKANIFQGVKDLWRVNEQISEFLVKFQEDEVSGRSLFLRRDRERADGRKSLPELGTDRMMLAAYPVVQPDSPEVGSRFTVHCDNPPGENLNGDNGRVLTFTFYPNHNWNASLLGGQIRIYPCGFSKTNPTLLQHWKLWSSASLQQLPTSVQESVVLHPDSDSYEVSPIANRLCIFFSDERAPHEVLPVKAKSSTLPDGSPLPDYRYAITQWFTFLSPEEQLRGLKEAMRAWIANRTAKKAAESN